MKIVKEKVEQAIDILNELNIDLWLIFCRESKTIPDPSMPLVVGQDVVGQSAFMISKTGETIAIVSQYDATDFINSGIYNEVITHTKDIAPKLRETLVKLDPKSIAINYSQGSSSADGLTHGMYLQLMDYLGQTPFPDRLISAEKLIFKVRGRKVASELKLLKKAAEIANECWKRSIDKITTGMTEIEIAELITQNMKKLGVTNSFEPIVNAGAKTSPGHGSPTNAVLEKGDLLHIDMGALYNGYCSDIQRLAYFKKDNETVAPEDLQEAFLMVKSIIDIVSKEYKTGIPGFEVDGIARKMLGGKNYQEFNHALGHQIGREVHDGAALVGPKWKKYGESTILPLEKDNVFTIELGIEIDGIGYTGLEEDLVVTDHGGEFLAERQLELLLK